MSAIPTVIAVLPETTENVPRYLTSCHLIVSMMTDNNNFLEPTPPLVEVTKSLDDLAAAEELAQRGGKGSEHVRLKELGVELEPVITKAQGLVTAAKDARGAESHHGDAEAHAPGAEPHHVDAEARASRRPYQRPYPKPSRAPPIA